MDAERRSPPAAAVAEATVADLTMADLTMADLMRKWPAVVPHLLRRGLACPGCAMAPFMTVREAAAAYGLDLGTLLTDLAAAMDAGSATSTETRRCTRTA